MQLLRDILNLKMTGRMLILIPVRLVNMMEIQKYQGQLQWKELFMMITSLSLLLFR